MMDLAGLTVDSLARGLFEGWKHSPGHRRNMLDPDVVDTGVAVALSGATQRYYAVQEFGRPRALMIRFSIRNDSGQAAPYVLDGREFTLAPGVTRTHGQCGAAQLSLGTGAGPSAVQPKQGQTYSIVPADGTGRALRLN